MVLQSLTLLQDICETVSSQLPDARLVFHTEGECKPWEDLRVCFFSYVHDRWDSSMGPFPTFGCYSFASIPDAILDIRRGRIGRWLSEIDNAIYLYENVQLPQDACARVQGLFTEDRKVSSLFEATLLISMFTSFDRELSEKALLGGDFFNFKLSPGCKFSDQVQALLIPDCAVGFYRKWWVTDCETVKINAIKRPQIIAHARLYSQQASDFDLPEKDASDALLKAAWGL